jgi:Tol biopolymer transport system component
VTPDGRRAAYLVAREGCGFGYRVVIGSIEDGAAVVTERCAELTFTPAPAWSPDGRLLAHGEGSTLAIIEADTGVATAIDLEAAGVDVGTSETEDSLLALAWASGGEAVEVVAGGALWRVPLDGMGATRVAAGPQPGGFLLEARIARSPDGTRLAAVTGFGAFVLEADGAWRRVSRVGGLGWGSGLTWSPDGDAIAYIGGDSVTGIDVGIIIAPVEGDAAPYRLTESGVASAPLRWLEDGRIEFALAVPGE